MSMELATLRRSPDAQVAGVCAGLARRYDVDPTLVRVAMFLLVLCSGVGLVIYGLLWALTPAAAEQTSPLRRAFPAFPRLSDKLWGFLTVVACLVVASLLHSVLPFGLLGAGAIIGIAAWWSRRRATPAAGESWPLLPEAAAGMGVPATGALARSAVPTPPALTARPIPAPSAASYSAPAPRPAASSRSAGATSIVPRHRGAARATWAVLATALVAAGADALWQAVRGTSFSLTELLSIAAVALGLGTLAAAGRGKPRVLAAITAACALALGATLVAPAVPATVVRHHSSAGDVTVHPATAAELTDVRTAAGDAEADYSGLALTADATTSVHTSRGDVRLVLPADANAVVTWRTSLGSYDGPDQHLDNARSGTYRYVVDPAKPTLTIDVSTSLGDIRVVKP